MDPGTLDRIVRGLDIKSHPNLIVGLDAPDDAGVYKLNEHIALIQTLDFLTPVTDSPYEFGMIAAANSLSDVYAMGGEPLTVMNIVCFPSCDLPEEILAETLKGGLKKIHESGATLVGGHSVDDPEFKYGLSVTGIVHPDRVLTNTGAKQGDAVILTKPVGTGVMATAIKAKLASRENIDESVLVMSMLNKGAWEAMRAFQVHGCTDITGFGLAGHLLEMAKGSKKNILIHTEKVPLLQDVLGFAKMGFVPAGAHRNRKFFNPLTRIDPSLNRALVDLMFDPQTSGGLLITLDPKEAGSLIQKMKETGQNAYLIGEILDHHSSGFLQMV